MMRALNRTGAVHWTVTAAILFLSTVSSQSVCLVDIAFVVDNSGSIRDSNVAGQPDNFNQVLEFMKQIVQKVTVSTSGNRIGAVSFGNDARVNFYLNQYQTTQQVVNAISTINYLGGNTNTTGGLRVMRQQIFNQANEDRSNVPNICILITDGIPTREVEQLPAEVQTNKNLGTRIIGVGVSAAVNETQLKSMVSNPSTDYFYVSNFTGLYDILDAITLQACRTVAPPTGSAPPPTQPVVYTGDASSCLVDIAFVVDNSGSIRDSNVAGQPDNFDQVKQFMRTIVQAVQASQDGNHFASVSYGNSAAVNFYFNQFYTTQQVLSAIDSIQYLGGNTNTTGGLRLMRQDIFLEAHGDRTYVPNLCILITDGITTREVSELPNEVQRIKDLGTRIIGVGVSAAVNEQELKNIVTNADTDYFYVSNFTGLYTLLDAIINRACQTFPSQPTRPPTSISTTPRPPTSPQDFRTLADGSVCLVDIAFVVDNSGSIRDTNVPGQPDNFNQVLTFMKDIVQTVQASINGNRFASVSFGNDAFVNFFFNSHGTTAEVVSAINSIAYLGGNTNTTGALRLMRQQVFSEANGDRPGVPNICLLITDGIPTRELEELPAEVQRVKALGTRILGVGVTRAVNETQLKSVVSNPDTDYFYVDNFDGLRAILDAIINRACQTFAPVSTVTTTPATTTTTIARASSLPTTTTTTTRASSLPTTTTTTTPRPTTVPEPIATCVNPVDVIFVLDDSGSIAYNNFATLRSFLAQLVSDFDVENDKVRVGLVTFSDDVEPRFNLNAYRTRAAIRDYLANMTFFGGRTNTPAVLRYIRTTMMTSSAGLRSGVPTLVVMVTDGGSTEKKATQDEAYALRNAGATVLVVGVGQWLDLMELNNLASYPYTDNRLIVNSYNDLASIQNRLNAATCNAQAQCSTNPCQNGGTCSQSLQVQTCLCPTGFSGRYCEKRCRVGADVAFIIDSSSVLGNVEFQRQLDLVRELVLSLNVNLDSRVALIVSADQSYIRFNLNELNSKLKILNGISQYYPAGKSDLAGALRILRTQVFGGTGDRPNIPNVAVIISYRGSINQTATVQEARLIRDQRTSILGVGVGSMISHEELDAVVSYPPTANAVYVNDLSSVTNVVDTISRGVCNEVNECATNPCLNSGECTDGINGYTCTCTNSYSGLRCEQAGSGRIDINIVLDSSGSIRNERFPYVLQFISDIVEQLEVSPDKTQVGLVQYSDTAHEVFRLNTYDNKQDVMDAVKRVGFMGGRTNAADALTLMMNPMFTASYGDRSDAPNIALVFTDGNWNVKAAETVPAAVAARGAGTYIIVFSVGTDCDKTALEAIASQPLNSTIFQAGSSSDLQFMITQVVKSFYNDVNDCASNPCYNGAACVDDRKRFVCRCAIGFTGSTCNRRCNRQMDVTLILDRSEYLDPEIYKAVVPLAKLIVQGLPVQSDIARVAIVTYAYDATVVTNLNTYSTAEDVLNAMSFTKSGSSRSNLQGSLRLLTQNVYTAGRGDRSSVSNLVVVITDGFATPSDPTPISQLASSARSEAGVEFFVVGLGAVYANTDNINSLADSRSDHISRLSSAQNIQAAADEVLERLCNPTLV